MDPIVPLKAITDLSSLTKCQKISEETYIRLKNLIHIHGVQAVIDISNHAQAIVKRINESRDYNDYLQLMAMYNKSKEVDKRRGNE